MQESGLYIPGDGKGLAWIRSPHEKPLLVATQNQGPLLIFSKKVSSKVISILPGDVNAEIILANGKKRKEEFYFGSSFYSQSGRNIIAGPGILSITITQRNGSKRSINF
jgi:hypothetical protein